MKEINQSIEDESELKRPSTGRKQPRKLWSNNENKKSTPVKQLQIEETSP
jgi:hypothetical protein